MADIYRRLQLTLSDQHGNVTIKLRLLLVLLVQSATRHSAYNLCMHNNNNIWVAYEILVILMLPLTITRIL